VTLRARLSLAAGLAAAGACGGSSPSGPAPVPTPVPGHAVVGVVFYDENADGQAQPDEPVRIPDVEVTVGGRSGRTEKLTGRAVVSGVPDGQHAVSVRPETLPPFYALGAPVSTHAPQDPAAPAMVPLVLPIGRNRPNVYMAFGDSITRQDGVALSALYPRNCSRCWPGTSRGPRWSTAATTARTRSRRWTASDAGSTPSCPPTP
jgi:hypothetical protein